MITCKYFQQGNCRFGQYCRFAHSYNVNFGANNASVNKPAYPGNKNVNYPAMAVAEEVLAVERGGQWLLSCFGPFKERPCIPGMQDLSPEEYRWEIYQAQGNGTVDTVKAQFQRLCEDMKTKRAVLKNPTQEIISMLDNLQKGGTQKSVFATNNPLTESSNFSFSTPQMALPNTSTSSSNVFGSNPFRSNTSTYGAAASTPSIFGGTTSSTTSSPFGAKPTFGSGPMFGGAPTTGSTFGGAVTTSSSPFTGTNQNASSFGATLPHTGSVFNAQPVFGQAGAFDNSSQANTPFGRLPSNASTNSVFGGTTTATNSLFGGMAPAQPTASVFGGNDQQNANSIFSGPVSSANSSSLFPQPKSATAFGGGPVFGGAPAFGGAANPAIFGGQSTFGGNTLTPSNSIFGGQTATAPSFASVGQTNPPAFGSIVKSPTSTFGGVQTSAPFGSAISTANQTPFGATVSTTSSPFVSSAGPFAPTTATGTPFSSAPLFGTMGQNTATTTAFGVGQTPSATPFGAVTSGTNSFGNPSPFGQSTAFGATSNSSPFSSTNATVTTTTANPFASQSQQNSSPFGVTTTNQGSIFSSTQSTPFRNSPFAAANENIVIDENAYSIEGQLTDDEKAMYLDKQFTLGKIPLKPPTNDIR